jgi:RecA-family ATPase
MDIESTELEELNRLINVKSTFLQKDSVLSSASKENEILPVSGEDLLKMSTDDLPFLWGRIFPEVGVGAVAGSSDTGKSAFLRQFAMAVVSGESEFLEMPLNAKHKGVLYVSTEDDEMATAVLMKKQNVKQLEAASYKGLRFVFNSDNLLDTLEKQLKSAPVDCLIIDAFTDVYGMELNSSNQVRTFINSIYNLTKQHKCFLLFLHHTGKKTESLAPHKDNLLGSQGFEAKMRVVLEIRKDVFDSTLRHLCILKGNYIPSDEKEKSHVLEFKDMVYKHTGQRVFLNELMLKPKNITGLKKQNERKMVNQKVIELHNKGLTTRQIENELRSQGHKIGKSTISTIVNQHQSQK